ncbi:MAG: sodium:proton exchanger [Hyphomonas sp.]|uniref:Sodium:proton exchanger n=2 Tax=Hyphomonas atlantica TaxID=1280948 RepID=A0A3B9L161_9PROT|nr:MULTISPECIES: sodium:proton antiporter [Hyphomonas]MAH92757.1 sodium:proton exchanger [Hyphomonas sp.]OUX87479.1 MAG: sodium:proton exchanger [Hyphomonas sp. TMED31]HAE94305.1 sodium:proton exchanger [Hyphomonas atlantica]HBH44909.1 sodium:proton exchanger [Hyphomonas atlantica]
MDQFDFALAAAGSSELIFACALIGALGIGAQWIAWRIQAPAIVLMALAGLAVGPLWTVIFGEPLLNPEKVFNGGSNELLRPIVSLAVAVILFEGGLVLKFENLRDAGAAVRRMVFLGGPLAWALGTFAAHYAAGLDWGSSVVFAGVLVVTGPTVIMPLLRQSKLGGRTGQFLKWEGIVNDPVGALFAVAAFEIIRVAATGESILGKGAMIIVAAALGVGLGFAFGWAIVRAFRQGWTPEYLKAPIIFASIILCYALAEMIEKEIGLVAVTAYGMTLANSRLAGLAELRKFKEDIAVLLVSGVFVILTANLTPDVIRRALTWNTLAFLMAMLFIVRPLSVWIATWGTLKRNEAILLGWIAPRGIVAVAVSSLFATLLEDLGRRGDSRFYFSGAEQITPLAFAMVFVTVVLHGFTIGPLARRLGLARKERPGVLLVGVNPWSIDLAKVLKDVGIEPILADNNWRRLRPAREAGLNTFFGEVLSEEAEVRLDHAAFDQVVGLSANEPYNALVSGHFAPELGRHRVYQLSAQDTEEEDPRAIGMGTRGRTLIRRGRGYDGLIRDHYRGWTFGKTKLTEEYDLAEYRKDRPKADIIAEIRPDGTLIFLGPNREARGGDGVTLISFGPAREMEVAKEPEDISTDGNQG